MALSPIFWGDWGYVWTFTFVQDGGVVYSGLPTTPSSYSLTFNGQDLDGSSIKFTGTGTFSVPAQTGATLGVVYYNPVASDVRPTGIGPWSFSLQVITQFPGRGPISSEIFQLIINPLLPAS